MSPHKIESLPSPAAIAEYGISQYGFLPAEPPLHRLPHASYSPWEELINDLPRLLQDGEHYRSLIDVLDILPTYNLESDAEWRRAYSILSMLAQGYIWGGSLPSERLPSSLAVPFLEVSERLQIHPVATYSGLNLWNTKCSPGVDLTRPENLAAMHTMTGTEDESWFYIVSSAMEAKGGPIITTMLSAMEAAREGDEKTVTAAFRFLSTELKEIAKLVERMDDRCDPDVFYHQIRPKLAGSRNMDAAGLPNGVFFDEGDGKGSWRKYRGGSNGQSPLIQFFDVCLGVRHDSPNFHREMREYMYHPHARFLNDLEEVANLRSFVESHRDRAGLVQAYDAAVSSLAAFRDKHIQLVTRYILLPSRKPEALSRSGSRKDLASMNSQVGSDPKMLNFVGTGGTKLIPFLKQTRDETLVAVMKSTVW